MKYILTFLSIFFLSSITFAQCVADAGPDQHKCLNDTANQDLIMIGGNPSANYGTPPYTYSWSINPIEFVLGSSFPYLYATDILSDTTLSNPEVLYEFAADSIMFYLTVTDSLGCISLDSCAVTFSLLGQHLYYYHYWINQGDSVFLNEVPNVGPGYGASTYNWSPSYGLSDTTLAYGFWASPDTTTAYTVTVTDSKGCNLTGGGPTYFIHIFPTGLSEINHIPVKLYPNPTSNFIFIETDANKPILKSELYSLTGKKLAVRSDIKDKIDLTPYPKGTYVLKLYFDDGVAIKKVIKK